MKIFNVLNLGAGWQSSRILLGMCRGELPKPDAAVFADTQWEPKAVYTNLEFLKGEAERASIPLVQVTAGPIRPEILEFMRSRKHTGRKRYASAPMFIKNRDGTQGRMKRQCTKEYKIEPVELWIRRTLLGLAPNKRVPKGVLVRQWFGISDDEASRATYPGRFKDVKVGIGTGLFGQLEFRKSRAWCPVPWRHHVYPLLNEVWLASRNILEERFLPRREQRQDCGVWLTAHYPGRIFPRSACVGCPFRSNAEWREMRDQRPEEWADACDFDDSQRRADAESQSKRKMLVGTPYVHRQMVPLRLVDLDGAGEKGGGCGTLYDGMDGLCNV
jgi:hypothetical protein